MSNDRPAPSKEIVAKSRRQFLNNTSGGFASLAMAGMLANDNFFNKQAVAADGLSDFENPLAARFQTLKAKAKSVIFLFMYGGPSQVDTFDYKPSMYALDNKTIKVRTKGRGGTRNQGRVVGPKYKFKQHGQCGKYVSSLFPNIATCVDDIAFLHSMTADSPIHGSALLMMNSGSILSGSPSLGSWITYGLGSENQNLPSYVVMTDPKGGPISGAKNWSSGFMPASYQGTLFRGGKSPILDLKRYGKTSIEEQKFMLERLRKFNEGHFSARIDNSNLAARIASYELAYNMQQHAPEAIDLDSESESTKEMYGMNQDTTKDFAQKCIMARRLVERGVRYVQVYSGGGHNDDNWDAHTDLEFNHNRHAGRTDKPIAALIKDLKQRGMLEETLIVWGGEFGRQPTAEYAKGTGRDHNSFGFTMWMAGGGVKGGVSYGKTDDIGNFAVENRLHVRDLHATVLHQMGIDPNVLSYFHGGLDKRLTGVEEIDPIWDIIA